LIMAESPKADDGKGVPAAGNADLKGKGAEPAPPVLKPYLARMIPGGSFEAARTPIGMNAITRDELPSRGQAHLEDGRSTREETKR
jgi:hypothetical protein